MKNTSRIIGFSCLLPFPTHTRLVNVSAHWDGFQIAIVSVDDEKSGTKVLATPDQFAALLVIARKHFEIIWEQEESTEADAVPENREDIEFHERAFGNSDE